MIQQLISACTLVISLYRERKGLRYAGIALLMLVSGAIACTAGSNSYQGFKLGAIPQWQCPTATPVPTATFIPTATPTYPMYLGLAPYFVSMNTGLPNIIRFDNISFLAQNAGNVYYSVTYYPSTGGSFPLSTNVFVGYSGGYPNPQPQISFGSTYAFLNYQGYLYIYAYSDKGASASVMVYLGPTNVDVIGPGLCYACVQGVINPTAVPTSTVVPSATPIIRTNDFFLNDWVVDRDVLKVGLRIETIGQGVPAQRHNVDGSLQYIYVWTVHVKNIGDKPYDTFPFLQTYISDLLPEGFVGDPYQMTPPPPTQQDVWGPSAWALDEVMPGAKLESGELGVCNRWWLFTGVCAGWDGAVPQDWGVEHVFTLAAYGPVNRKVFRIGYALDMTQRPTPGALGAGQPAPTGVPGNSIISWINEIDPFPNCHIEIVEP